MVLADALGDILLTAGMKQVGEVTVLRPRELWIMVRRAMGNPLIGLGVSCLAIGFFLFLTLLSWADLSLVMPMTALGYPVSVLGTRYLLKENVSTQRFMGTVLICIGVALISLNSTVS
jgi:drug/metabolite transporter (DMT)-like permease